MILIIYSEQALIWILYCHYCSRTCVDINVRRVWRTCSRRCKTMETKRYGKLLSRTCRNNRNLRHFSHGGKNFADKTAPILGSRNGPQNGGHSLSLNLICLCPGGLAPVLGSVSGPQNGARFCRQNLSRRARKHDRLHGSTAPKNSESFDCFRGRATKVLQVLHTAGRSMVLQRREHLFSCSPHPANIYVHTCS